MVGLAVLAILLPAASCSAPGPQAPLPGKPGYVTITMTEYHLGVPASVPAGRVVFRVVNHGQLAHSLLMFPEDPDAPPLDKQLHGSVRRAVEPLAEVLPRSPGQSGTFAVSLAPGQRYGIMSTSVGSDGVPDFLKGMNAELRPRPSG